MFFKIGAPVAASLFNKVADFQHAISLKRHRHRCFLANSAKFQEHVFFTEHLRATASDTILKRLQRFSADLDFVAKLKDHYRRKSFTICIEIMYSPWFLKSSLIFLNYMCILSDKINTWKTEKCGCYDIDYTGGSKITPIMFNDNMTLTWLKLN